ncbi:MAG: hypothetical protein ACKVKF_10720 [Rhodobacterales bacterium]|nr:hypothetical protein [Puniceibacterium antarcticum]
MKWILLMALTPLLAACAEGFTNANNTVSPASEAAAATDQTRPVTRTAPAGARTAAQFDVTSAAERSAAATRAPGGERSLGSTVASLGDPSRVGFWLETPLVSTPSKGRVTFAGSGKTANVDLIPIDGPSTAGSRLSLSAMRLIEAPLTGLPTVKVFVGG